jgi:hypothetical protein
LEAKNKSRIESSFEWKTFGAAFCFLDERVSVEGRCFGEDPETGKQTTAEREKEAGYSFESRGVWGKERGYNLVISGGIVRGKGSSGSSV